ncbi:MAG: hypothetical protein NZ957_01445 [Thaumarchaeota archaeon]|nr:hypothetical protein [Candidatus Calditenuaceae archaeon]
MRAVVDASFLIRAVELGRDLLTAVSEKLGEPLEPYTIPQVLHELKGLSSGKGTKALRARAALEVAGSLELLEIDDIRAPTDEVLVMLSRTRGHLILTSDLEVMRTVLRKGGKVALVTEEGEVKLTL